MASIGLGSPGGSTDEHALPEEENENDPNNFPIPMPHMFLNEHVVHHQVEWAKIEKFGEDVVAHSQIEKLSDEQVKNSTGMFVYTVSDKIRVRRFLILGTSGGTYYASEKELTLDNADHILNMIKQGKGLEVLKEVEEIDKSNRAPKMTPIIFVLALVARNGDSESKRAAYNLLNKICRIPTHLFQFIGACEKANNGKSTGWGRMHRLFVSDWYFSKSVKSLLMAVTKYQKREGWSHRDVLRLAHPVVRKARALKRKYPESEEAIILELDAEPDFSKMDLKAACAIYNDIFLYCTKGFSALLDRHPTFVEILPVPKKEPEAAAEEPPPKTPEKSSPSADTETKDSASANSEGKKKSKAKSKKKEEPTEIKRFLDDAAPSHLKFLQGVEDLKKLEDKKDENEAISLIKRFGLVREHVSSQLLNSATVWRAMLHENMPMTAMIRNLAKMTAIGLVATEENGTNNRECEIICQKLRDVNALKQARIHPFNVLLASTVYKLGRGDKGKLTWTPNKSICEALEDAFYASFVNVRPTNKRFLLALDVSGSMMARMSKSVLSCREASAALSMITLRTEPVCEIVAFQNDLQPLDITKKDTLSEVNAKISDLPFAGTDCSLPMLWAAKNKKKFDCMIVYTDNETAHGDIHPSEAMRLYRKMSGIADAKLIVIGMTATGFTIADPNDPNMMDIVGFDSAAPELIRSFVASGFDQDDPSAATVKQEPNEDDWAMALDSDEP